mmetsp:Transcript_5491/g.17327  ORF Transcript_5491/g.17327 Transcript_5491/m.17327 type:complete len:214 (+) Transcript_5491:548-1189(+)
MHTPHKAQVLVQHRREVRAERAEDHGEGPVEGRKRVQQIEEGGDQVVRAAVRRRHGTEQALVAVAELLAGAARGCEPMLGFAAFRGDLRPEFLCLHRRQRRHLGWLREHHFVDEHVVRHRPRSAAGREIRLRRLRRRVRVRDRLPRARLLVDGAVDARSDVGVHDVLERLPARRVDLDQRPVHVQVKHEPSAGDALQARCGHLAWMIVVVASQ